MASRTSPSLGEQVRLLGIGIQSGGLRSTSLAAAPFRAFAGATSAGGTVDVYVDGMHVHHAGVRPGRSPLRNIARFAGLRPVEVVMRDAAGREVRAIRSGFAADRLLPAGASEYEYMAGNARLDTAGGGYGDLALVASHRTALTDKLTLGGYFDRIGGDFSGTVGVGARLDDLGAVSGEFGMAREDTAPMATSAAIRYTHSVGPLSLTLGYLRADSAYLSDEEGAWAGSPANLVEDVGAKLSYSLPMIGTFTLTSTRSTYEGAAPQTLTTLSYSFEREGRWRLDWTLAHRSRTPEATDASGWLAGLNLTVALDEPGTGTSAPTFGWMAQARRALGTGPAGAHAQDAHLPTLATDALASAHRFDTPAGILYGRVDAGDVAVSAPPAWQLGWSGSVLGARGVWAPRKPDDGI
jgi:outer membrane usher protein FimD/PapC